MRTNLLKLRLSKNNYGFYSFHYSNPFGYLYSSDNSYTGRSHRLLAYRASN